MLFQNTPNPFNPETNISFQLPTNETVKLEIYNILGEKIKTLVKDNLNAGYYNFLWNGYDEAGAKMSSGIYIYRVQIGTFIQSKKMLMMK